MNSGTARDIKSGNLTVRGGCSGESWGIRGFYKSTCSLPLAVPLGTIHNEGDVLVLLVTRAVQWSFVELYYLLSVGTAMARLEFQSW